MVMAMGDVRTLPNPKRGCGHLERGKAYIRGVVGSPGGTLPSFVQCDPYVPYREIGTDGAFTRGYMVFAGVPSQFAVDDLTDFTRLYPGDATDAGAVENMITIGVYPNTDAVPDFEGQRHVDRVRNAGTKNADHFGAIDTVRQNDVLMRCGKTHYPDATDFIEEAVEIGISKAIPLSQRQDPPVVQPGVTRCWIVHPDTDAGWAVIGYAYLNDVVYTMPDDGNVPQYIQEHADADRVDVVDIEPAPTDDDELNTHVSDYLDDPSGDGDDGDDSPADWDELDYNELKSVAASHGVDVGPTPDRDTLEDTLADHGITLLEEDHDD
jgi:hypothetical protein